MTEVADTGANLVKRFLNKISGQPESYSRKSRYTFGKTLGAGSFGIVRYARDNETDEEVAVKIILKKALKGNEQMIIDELHLLQELHHPHIVGFRDWFESKDKFYLVTQLATGGELFDRIIKLGRFTEHDASLVIVEVLEALDYLHNRNIVHRDLKPENILYLNPSQDSNVVLADFGIAKKLGSESEKILTLAGSFGYAAPEVIMGEAHGKSCDIWSLGVITYTVLCGYSPFRSENAQDFISEVKNNNAVIFHADYWKDVSKDARRFIIKALQYDPENRPTARQLLEDPWLVSVGPSHTHADLLPQLKERFDGKAKFRQAIELVKLHNRIKKLKSIQTDEDDDPHEIDLFGDQGSISSTQVHDQSSDVTVDSDKIELKKKNPLFGWKSFADSLKNVDTASKSSLSKESPASNTIGNEEGGKKKEAATSAFFQLVAAATQNKDRVRAYEEGQEPDASAKQAPE